MEALAYQFLIVIGSLLLYLATFLAPVAGLAFLAHTLLALPLKRRERARLFLDLMETAISQGKPIEQTLVSISNCRDRSPGVRFHLLAAYLEKGFRLGEALQKVPRLLPPEITAMLRAGERIGDLRKVLPACRQTLNDSVSQVRGALNYLLVLALVTTPLTTLLPIMLAVVVAPKFREIFLGVLVQHPLPTFTAFVLENGRIIAMGQFLLLTLLWSVMVAYVGGPRLRQWLERLLPGVPDAILYRLPWRRKRLQRDFSAVLSILLDSDVPETEAVAIAAETTSNSVMRRNAVNVCALLNRGVKLPEAVSEIDTSGELKWRLTNALRRGHDFLRALTGWHESLDARAFQQEQAAAQITTSALVLFNGFIVATIVIAVFLALTDIINEAALW
jgi:type II secretory pathway component PulF